MTKRTRRNHSAAFKAKVALATLKGDKTLAELVQHFDVHPNQVTEWKRQLLERARDVFDGTSTDKVSDGPGLKTLHALALRMERRAAPWITLHPQGST